MAAISLSDCTVSDYGFAGGIKFVKIVTPATADDGDTIDCSSLFSDFVFSVASGSTDGSVLDSATVSTSITLPGSTDDEARTIIAFGH